MLGATNMQADLLAAAEIIVAAMVVATLLIALRRMLDDRRLAQSGRPYLPLEDRPPVGLGRLIPVGAQVDDECRRGTVALEHWLLSRRQAGREGS
ncbi:MAG: hypothetical protein JJD92_03320 [Frankiaceae bacterium]|nr:hypothetical protein [Frankiaceae bacterium]